MTLTVAPPCECCSLIRVLFAALDRGDDEAAARTLEQLDEVAAARLPGRLAGPPQQDAAEVGL